MNVYCSLPMFHPLVTKHDKYCSSIPVDCVCRISCCPFVDQAEECIQIHIVTRTTSQSAKSPRTSFVLAPRPFKLAADLHERQRWSRGCISLPFVQHLIHVHWGRQESYHQQDYHSKIALMNRVHQTHHVEFDYR